MKIENMHIHSMYSWDCQLELKKIANTLLDYKIKYAAITDHIELDRESVINIFGRFDKRNLEIKEINKKNKNNLLLLEGLEISSPHLHKSVVNYLNILEMDFIIGSIHKIDKKVTQDYEKEKATMLYYKEILKMIEARQIDIIGHLDYINRYYEKDYSNPNQIKEIIDAIIENNLILEINTSAKRRCNQEVFPSIDKLTYYKEHGGKYVTIGTDAHREEEIIDNLDLGHQIAQNLELTPVIYKKRKIEKI